MEVETYVYSRWTSRVSDIYRRFFDEFYCTDRQQHLPHLPRIPSNELFVVRCEDTDLRRDT